MASATVTGANGETVNLTFDTQANAVIAQIWPLQLRRAWTRS